MRRTESVAFHQFLRLVLIELGKTARNMISRSSSSDVLGLLVPRLALPSRGASRALFVIVMVARGKGRALRSYSFLSRRGEAECPSLVLRRGGVLALILRLSSRSASRRFVSSCRLVSRLVLRCPASRGRGVLARLIVIILLVGRGSWCRDCSFRLSSRRAWHLFPSRRFVSLLVSGSGEALFSRFIPTVSGGAAVLVLLSRWRCLLALMPSENGVMSFSSSAFPPVYYHPMAAERGACAVSSFGSSSPASCSLGYRSCLGPLIQFDGRNGRRDGGLLGYRGVARRLMYIMNMMYAMYIKDIKI